MKRLFNKLLLFSGIITLGFATVSCGGDDDPELFSESIVSADGLQIDLTWTINGEAAGNTFVDIDVVLDDLEQGSGVDAYEADSGSGSNFESMTLSDAVDGVYHLAPWIYNFESEDEAYTMSQNIVLTFSIYPVGDDSNPVEVTQKFTYENYNPDAVVAYAKYTITKEGDDYTVKALSQVTEVNSGWAENL